MGLGGEACGSLRVLIALVGVESTSEEDVPFITIVALWYR